MTEFSMTDLSTEWRLRLTPVLAITALLLFAGPSLAGTMYFGEILTASEMAYAANLRATLDSNAHPSTFNILFDGDITSGAGFGSGYVGGGSALTYTHRFTPSEAWESVTSATLALATIDDQWFDGRESVKIELNDEFWQKGNASFNLFGGNVTALFANNESELKVSVISRRGDTIVPMSKMVWEYETASGPETGNGDPGNGARPVPEPTALALFGIGMVVVRQASRRYA